MNHLRFLSCSILGASLLAPAASALPQGMGSQAAVVQQSSIIFAGTVSQLGATSFSEVPKSAQTIVVRVESVLKKPPAVSLKKGDNVTVEVKDPSAFRPGMEATFYTDGWMFGSGVAVKELSHEARPSGGKPGRAGVDERVLGQIEEQISDQELKQRLALADFVVIAKVTDVRPWTVPDAASVPHRVTEHDPDWHDAVIKIESVLKGPKPKKNKLVVRFPQCNDVAWAHAPKFEKHQEGIFFLMKDEVSGAPVALLEGTEVNAYTCLRPGDWLPKSDAARLRSLLKKMSK
jgi:hypothetical protein